MAAAAVAGAAAEGIIDSSTPPPVLFAPPPELAERMDDKFLDALRKGDERVVKSFVSSVPDEAFVALGVSDHARNVTERKGWRGVTVGGNLALHIVAGYGHRRLAELICAEDAPQLTARNAALETPLHWAARAGSDQIVSLFISAARREGGCRLGELLRAKDREGKTALYAAAQHGHAAAARALTSEDPGLVTVCGDDGISPLYAAVLSKSREVVQILIGSLAKGGEQVGTSAGASPKASYAGPNGQTALHAAAIVESPEIADELLKWKATLANEADIFGSTPLHHLATTSNSCMVRQLLERDSSSAYLPDLEEFCPIHVAARMGRDAVIRELIEHCPNMNELVDDDKRNFLHIAVLVDSVKVVKYVCRDPMLVSSMTNARDYKGNTPLHLAVREKNQNVVSLLLRNRSVNTSITNNAGQTPLDLARIHIGCGLRSMQDEDVWIFHCLSGIEAISGSQRPDIFLDQAFDKQDHKEEQKKYESASQNLVIASVLIATVTFAAAFTMPGGNIEDNKDNKEGTPILAKKYAFKAFIISDFLAFLCSIIATAWLTYAGSLAKVLPRKVILRFATFINIAEHSLMAAFALSMYVVLAPISIAIGLVICIFAFPAILLTSPYIWQCFHLARTLKSRLGWSGMCRSRLTKLPLGSSVSFYWFIFGQIKWYLLVYIIILLAPLGDDAILRINEYFNP